MSRSRTPIEPADPSRQSRGARTELEPEEVRQSEETVDADSEPTVKAEEPGRAQPRLAPGEVLAGRFIVRRFIARGGMGEVYEAEDQELRSRVALKTVLASFATDDTALERLKREVLLGRRVSHPNVCRTHELYVTRTADGKALRFLTMEFLDGETLARRLRREGRLSTDETRILLKHIVAALDAAHAEGVIHRDFKSSNVLLVPRDEPGISTVRAVVTDFGIAHVAHPVGSDAPNANVSGQVTTLAGTPAYMAPEQLNGGVLSPATDVYALGVVLYEMLTGELPFSGDALLQRPRPEPVHPRSRVPNLSQRWNAAVLRCLEAEPQRRFRTAQEVLRAVEGTSQQPRPEMVPGLTDPLISGLYTRASESLLTYDPWECRRAVALFEQLITLEPGFAPGWARLAAACIYMGTFFDPEDPRWARKAEHAARTALAISPDDADAHCALARSLWSPANSFQHRAALASFTHALELDPSCQQALTWKGGVLSHVGLLREADELLKEALELRPDDSGAGALLVQNAYYDNRFDEADEMSARTLTRNPTDTNLISFRPAAALYTNRLEDAETQIRQARQGLPDNPVSHGHEALLWALRGEGLRSEECVARALAAKVLLTTHHGWHYAAAALAVLDRPAEALRVLERAASVGLPSYPAFRDDRFLVKLNDHPPYRVWLAGLEHDWLEYRRDFGSPSESV
jgi:serine/threonine protein kinase/Flp pilus assembly protein TadD